MEKNLQTWQIAHMALQRFAVNFLLKHGKHPFERIELRPPACDKMAEVIGPATVTRTPEYGGAQARDRPPLGRCLSHQYHQRS